MNVLEGISGERGMGLNNVVSKPKLSSHVDVNYGYYEYKMRNVWKLRK
jgi:hypothetical protein